MFRGLKVSCLLADAGEHFTWLVHVYEATTVMSCTTQVKSWQTDLFSETQNDLSQIKDQLIQLHAWLVSYFRAMTRWRTVKFLLLKRQIQ